MSLAMTLACGSFLGFLPGNSVMTAEAAETGTVSGGDAETQFVTPTDLQWASLLGGGALSDTSALFSSAAPYFNGEGGNRFEVEIYLNGELYKTVKYSGNTVDGFVHVNDASVRGWCYRDGETGGLTSKPYNSAGEPNELVSDSTLGYYKEEGKYTYRVRAVSADGNSFSEWSEFSKECDNTKEAFLAVYGPDTDNSGSGDGAVDSSDESSSTNSNSSEDREDTANDTVTSSSGEVLTTSAAVNVTGTTSAIVRTPQGTVTAAAAAAAGGLKEGQYVMATVGDSQCGELARQAVTNAASSVNGKVVSYLEITLNICNPGGGVDRNVEQISTPIEFTVTAPADIDGSKYDFAVVRLHGDGKVDILPDLDNDPATITFQTDRFSVYAVIYGAKGAFGVSGKDNVPKTGDSTVPVLPFAAVGAACAAAAVVLRRKAQA